MAEISKGHRSSNKIEGEKKKKTVLKADSCVAFCPKIELQKCIHDALCWLLQSGRSLRK